jgi:hypothetical protein
MKVIAKGRGSLPVAGPLGSIGEQAVIKNKAKTIKSLLQKFTTENTENTE